MLKMLSILNPKLNSCVSVSVDSDLHLHNVFDKYIVMT